MTFSHVFSPIMALNTKPSKLLYSTALVSMASVAMVAQSAQAETMYVYKDSSGQTLLTNMGQPTGNLGKFKRQVSKKTYRSTNNNYYPNSNYNTYNNNSYYSNNSYNAGYYSGNNSGYYSTNQSSTNYGNPSHYGYSSYSSSSKRDSYDYMIKASANRYGVDPALVKAIIHTESAFNPSARSSAGAQGLMQLMPGTARDLNVYNPWNPSENIDGGTKYIAQLLRRFDNNAALALAGYNAGPNRESLRNGRIPNIRETKNYVKRVLSRYHTLYKNDPNLQGDSNYYYAGSNYSSGGSYDVGRYEVSSLPATTNVSTTRTSYNSGSASIQPASYGTTNGNSYSNTSYSKSYGSFR